MSVEAKCVSRVAVAEVRGELPDSRSVRLPNDSTLHGNGAAKPALRERSEGTSCVLVEREHGAGSGLNLRNVKVRRADRRFAGPLDWRKARPRVRVGHSHPRGRRSLRGLVRLALADFFSGIAILGNEVFGVFQPVPVVVRLLADPVVLGRPGVADGLPRGASARWSGTRSVPCGRRPPVRAHHSWPARSRRGSARRGVPAGRRRRVRPAGGSSGRRLCRFRSDCHRR